MTTIPEPPPIVTAAIEALTHFGLVDLNRTQAAILLGSWARRAELDPDQRQAVLEHFPAEPVTHPAWCDQQHGIRAGHQALVGTEPTERISYEVGLFLWSRPVITVDLRIAVVDGDDQPTGETEVWHSIAMAPDAARRVAARLIEAADRLGGAA